MTPAAYPANAPVTKQKAIRYDSTVIALKEIPPKELNKLFNDPDYDYNKVAKAHKTFFERFIEWFWRKLEDSVYSKNGQTSITIIQYIFIALAIVLIIFLLLKHNIRSLFYGKSATSINSIETPEDLHQINFDQRIAYEVSRKDFRKAIRLHFLRIIKELSDQKLINWQLDKTNTDYLRELKNSKYSHQFEEFIRLYEYIWYGDFKLDEASFLMVIQKFNQFELNHVS